MRFKKKNNYYQDHEIELLQPGYTPVNNPENPQVEKRTYPLPPKQFVVISRIPKNEKVMLRCESQKQFQF